MQHAVRDGPGLHRSYASCRGIGIDSDQRNLAGSRGSQPGLGIIHNLSSQRTQALTPCIDECQNYLATTQGRKGDRSTKLVNEIEVRYRIAVQWKAADGVVVRLWYGCLGTRSCKKFDATGSPANDYKC